jgi:chemotaxis protein methyltransferase CheR
MRTTSSAATKPPPATAPAAAGEAELDEADFRRVADLVYRHCKINLHDGKMALVRSRLAKRLRETGLRSATEYLDLVESNPGGEEFTKLIDAISTNLTSFFREAKHFEHLSRRFLPDLIARNHRAGRPLRIRGWSAGCSSGEEPYSLAITLLEATAGAGAADVKLLATDISTRVLRTAQAGVYGEERLGGVSPELRQRYFTKPRAATAGGRGAYEVAQAVRDVIRFRHLNLMERWPFTGPFDFIFCRNVMIYFDKPTQQDLVARYYDCLGRGGLLFTGHSESLTGIKHRFSYVEPTIYLKD